MLDPAIEAQGYEVMRSVVEVDLVDGRRLVQPSDDRYRGGPDLPFSREELHAKFIECGEMVLPVERLHLLLERIEALEQVADVRELAGIASSQGVAPDAVPA